MATITIDLPENQAKKLQELAQAAGTTPEALVLAGVEEWLTRPEAEFSEVAAYVLRKNAELYRRLA
jgi:predicted transcriptional regulator